MSASQKPVSVRNNNPLNLRSGQPYEGLATPSQRDGFCNFIHPIWGFRAAARNYITKFDRGVNTVRKLITEWAPAADNNDTASYIAHVCASADFGPDEVINLKSWEVASKICYAQAVVESGQPFEVNWKMADMAEGALRAGIVDAPKSPIKKLGVVVTGTASAASAAAPQVIDAINTYSPVIGQVNSAGLKTFFSVAAVVFACVAIFNHIRSAK